MDRLVFEIRETRHDAEVTLALIGELDLATAPRLEQRLKQLHRERRPVRLDLSGLSFIDSTGIHVMVTAIKAATTDGWRFVVDPTKVPGRFMRLFEIVGLDRLIARDVNLEGLIARGG